jgi:hypothetical protein
MNKIFFSLAVLVSSIFADTLYLKNGEEIKDVTVIEIDASEVKYKIGKDEILCTMGKADIINIVYSNDTKETFDSDFNLADSNQSSQKLCVHHSNLFILTLPLTLGFLFLINAFPLAFEPNLEPCNFTAEERWGTWGINLFLPGFGSLLVMNDIPGAITQWVLLGSGIAIGVKTENASIISYFLIVNFIYNSLRSGTYNEPRNIAYNKHEGFNFAVMPNRHGNLLPAVTFSKTF